MKFLKSLLLAVTVAVTAACTQIDTGHVGVEATFGQVKGESLPPGVYFSAFKTIEEISAKENALELNDMGPKTKDNVTLQDMDLTIYFRVDPAQAAKLYTRYAGDLYKEKGMEAAVLGAGLVRRIARESVYNAVTKFNASDVHTKRTEIAADIRASLAKEIADDAGKGSFEITNVIVRNIVTDKGLEASIKRAADVEFQVREKQRQLELEVAEANRKRVAAEGEAKANSIISASLTPQLIELRRIEAMTKFAEGKGSNTIFMPQGGGVTPLLQVK